jgi:hypothetical protein
MTPGRTDTGFLKRERVRQMHAMLQGAGDVDLSRFVATVEYNMGLTPKKVMEYLQILVRLGFIEVNEATNVVREVKPE